jgi:biotin-dependent carboxylase-like uncharacterized protein
VITIVGVSGLATVQDLGRPGHMHEGVPPGGPLVPELLARANAAVGNDDDEAGLELFGAVTLAGTPGTLVASDEGSPVELRTGEEWKAERGASTQVRYVAVRGGIDVPRVLGGRGTLLAAGLGGHQGRALRRGDALPTGNAGTSGRRPVPPAPDLTTAIGVIPGPDLERFDASALAALFADEFRVDARSDRVGLRLDGPTLRRLDDDTRASCPMVRGAIQVPGSGSPIVLGPDHPTTGGYPVLAVVTRASLGALGARPAGAAIRFVAAR